MGAALWQASPLTTQGSKPSPGLLTKKYNTHQKNLFKPDKTQQNLFKRNKVSQHVSNSNPTLGAKYQTFESEEINDEKGCPSEIKTNQEIDGGSFCLRDFKTISTIRGGCATVSEQAAEYLPTPARSTTRRLFLVRSLLQLLAAVVVGHLMQFGEVAGGICWASMGRNGRCTELTAEKVSKEDCCAAGQVPGAAWSPDDLESGALFFWRALGGGVPCAGCRESCLGVQCGAERRCALRRGRPRCVCAPHCGGGRAGPVCGTDGRSYRSLCRLRKRACRRRASDLTLDYYGHCQNSCARIRCGGGRHCLVDQDSRAHCVRCARTCPHAKHAVKALAEHGEHGAHDKSDGEHEEKALCGANGITYPSACHLRAAACRKGKSIPVAYRGPCNPRASCGSVRCRARQACLLDTRSGAPRCVTCSTRCPRARRALCATNNHTYPSWCHMLRDACATGYVIETRHAGSCGSVDLDEINTVSNEDISEDEETEEAS